MAGKALIDSHYVPLPSLQKYSRRARLKYLRLNPLSRVLSLNNSPSCITVLKRDRNLISAMVLSLIPSH